MTETQARRTFAELMAKARAGQLTERDRRILNIARQTLRKTKRPVMNPKTFHVVGIDDSGNVVYYTGRAGNAFVSQYADEAFSYSSESEAQRRATNLNRMTRAHGFTFDVHYKGNPSRQLLRRGRRPRRHRGTVEQQTAMNPRKNVMILVVWADERGKPYAALWKARGNEKDVQAADQYAKTQGGRAFTFPTARGLTEAKRTAIRAFLSTYPRGAEYTNPPYIKTGSQHLLITKEEIDSWTGRPKYWAGGNWWYWDSITNRLKRENYQGQRGRRYGKIVETHLAEIIASRRKDKRTPKGNPDGVYLVRGLNRDGSKEFWYTGKAGRGWVSTDKNKAFEYTDKWTAEHKAKIFNQRESLTGLAFHATLHEARKNPTRSELRTVRIGRAVEVRYKRDIGRSPGYYKHEIKSRRAGVYTIPPGWVYVGTKSILITEKEPRV